MQKLCLDAKNAWKAKVEAEKQAAIAREAAKSRSIQLDEEIAKCYAALDEFYELEIKEEQDISVIDLDSP